MEYVGCEQSLACVWGLLFSHGCTSPFLQRIMAPNQLRRAPPSIPHMVGRADTGTDAALVERAGCSRAMAEALLRSRMGRLWMAERWPATSLAGPDGPADLPALLPFPLAPMDTENIVAAVFDDGVPPDAIAAALAVEVLGPIQRGPAVAAAALAAVTPVPSNDVVARQLWNTVVPLLDVPPQNKGSGGQTFFDRLKKRTAPFIEQADEAWPELQAKARVLATLLTDAPEVGGAALWWAVGSRVPATVFLHAWATALCLCLLCEHAEVDEWNGMVNLAFGGAAALRRHRATRAVLWLRDMDQAPHRGVWLNRWLALAPADGEDAEWWVRKNWSAVTHDDLLESTVAPEVGRRRLLYKLALCFGALACTLATDNAMLGGRGGSTQPRNGGATSGGVVEAVSLTLRAHGAAWAVNEWLLDDRLRETDVRRRLCPVFAWVARVALEKTE